MRAFRVMLLRFVVFWCKERRCEPWDCRKKEYFLWYDDIEYCLRLMDAGGITVVPDAVLQHKTVLSKEGMVAKGVLHRIGWRQYYGYRNRYDTAKDILGN